MHNTKLYHNPRCSKCRAALALLRERSIEPQIIPYLEQPLSLAELSALLQQLGFTDARALMRKGESEYQGLGLDDPTLPQDALLTALAEHPVLIERPVFVHQGRAIIGRPPERVLEIL